MANGINKQVIQVGGSANDKGFFADLTALQTAYPTGQDGWYAVLGSTDTVWVWDSGTTDWVNSGSSGTSYIFTNGVTETAGTVELGGSGALTSLNINGSGGAGHIHLKHQSADPSSQASSSTVFADSNGNIAWINNGLSKITLDTDGVTAPRTYTFQDKSYTVADNADVVTKQPLDAGLTSISALTGAGYVKATATDTFSQVTTIPNTDITGLGTLSTQSGTFSGTHSGTSSGTNTGDQTSIVGITGTKAQFDTAVTDGNFMYVGDAPTAHTHLLANITDVTMTVANLNSLDDGVNSTLHFHDADRARANHTGTQLASTISDFTESSQDAVGAMVDTSLVYVDATPLLTRAALTGAITAPQGSNATSLGSFTTAQLNTALSDNDVATGGGTATGTNTGDQSLFSTIAVSGQSNVVADSTSDTLTLVAGTNITITTNATTDEITINSTGGGGGTMTVQDEGSITSTTVTALNFTGAGVTASGSGATATINISGGGGGSSTKGIAEVDFGVIGQESDIAVVTVTDASISTTSYPSATMYSLATTDHDPDDYMAEGLTAYITNIVNGVGFDIAVRAPNLTWGKYKVTYLY